MTEQDYFERGYFITTIPDYMQPKLWQLVYTTDWVEKNDCTHLQYPTKYVRVPEWHPEITGVTGNDHYCGSKDPNKHPKELVEIANNIIKEPLFSVVKEYHDLKLKYLTMWNGSSDLPWHSDINDTTDMIVLLYLTEEIEWIDSWGGTIEFRKNINGGIYYKKIYPLSGTMIVINNTNPLMQHQVTPMINNEINRYTFNFCYKGE
jgi:hypothetical protein